MCYAYKIFMYMTVNEKELLLIILKIATFIAKIFYAEDYILIRNLYKRVKKYTNKEILPKKYYYFFEGMED